MPTAENGTSGLFEPVEFQAMVDAHVPARGLLLKNSTPKDISLTNNYSWITRFGRFTTMAELNSPNSKANPVPRQGEKYNQNMATLAYMRETDSFDPTAVRGVRDISQFNNPSAIKSAQAIIAQAVKDVNDRFDNRTEDFLWQALQGSISYSGPYAGPLSVDFNFKANHKITLATSDQYDNTSSPTIDSLISNIRNAKERIRKDSGVEVTEVFGTRQTLDLLMSAFTKAGRNLDNKWITDAQVQQYMQTGQIGGFMGVESWTVVNQYRDEIQADGAIKTVSSLPHGKLIFANRTANNPIKVVEGISYDLDAPEGFTGRFGKNWTEKDPSGYKFLLEESSLPIISLPDQFLTMQVASTSWSQAQEWNN